MKARWVLIGGLGMALAACSLSRPDGAYYVHDMDNASSADGGPDGGSAVALDAAASLDGASTLDAKSHSDDDASIVFQ